jgi:hypothetical protein
VWELIGAAAVDAVSGTVDGSRAPSVGVRFQGVHDRLRVDIDANGEIGPGSPLIRGRFPSATLEG